MASNGAGVNKDAAGVPLRLTFYDSNHADAQMDQTGDFHYNLHKVWACMGRVGVNGTMRDGLVEEGDPLNGWAAGTIESVVGGVPVGVPCWNTLNGYNPLGGLAANDYTLYGALAPFDGVMHHLDVGLGAQPAFACEYWTGAAWGALTLTVTPDFTCVGGILNQRSLWTLPANWAAVNAAGLGLGLINLGTYYYMRFRNTAPLGAGPLANQRYKDYLYGHIKHFYFHYGFKRGDDTANNNPTDFAHPGDVIVRFRDGFSLEGRNGLSGTNDWGSELTSPQPSRPTIDSGGTVICSSGKGPVVFGGLFAGAMIMGRPRHSNHNMAMAFRGSATPMDMIGTLIMGHGAPSGSVFGGATSAVLRRLSGMRYCPHPLFDAAAGMGFMNPYAISGAQDAFVEDVVIDVRNSNANKWLYGIRSTVVGQVRIGGITFTDSYFTGGVGSGQIVRIATAQLDLFDVGWGGAADKVSSQGTTIEWRRIKLYLHLDGSTTPLPGIPVRFRESDGTLYTDVVTEADGHIPCIGPGFSQLAQDRFPASTWLNANPTTEVIQDEPLSIEINPTDHPNYESAYATQTIKGRFGRALLFDVVVGDSTERDWQRVDWVAVISLPPASGGGPPTGPLTTDDLPLEAEAVQRIMAEVP